MTREPTCREGPPRLMGIHSGALGDVILFGQLLAGLRQPGECVTLVAAGATARLLGALGVVDDAIDFDSLPMHEVFSDRPTAEGTLSGQLGPCRRLVSCFAAGDRRYSARLAEVCRAGRADFLPIRPAAVDDRHLVAAWADQMGGAEVPTPRWLVPGGISARAREALRAIGLDASCGFVAMHIGSGSPAKCWPTAAFEQLADELELPTVFLLGPVEAERMDRHGRDALRGRRRVMERPTLGGLAGVLAAATVFVGNDSGPSHLAAAVGTPTLSLFGPTRPANFAPRGRRVRTLRHEPLDALPVEAVEAEVRRLLCRLA